MIGGYNLASGFMLIVFGFIFPMRWFFIGVIWLLNSGLLVIFIYESITNFRRRFSMTKDNFILKNSIFDIFSFFYNRIHFIYIVDHNIGF